MSGSGSARAPRVRCIACGVFERELIHLAGHSDLLFDIELLDAGLHSRPGELHRALQDAIDHTAPDRYDAVGLLYGLCGRAAIGLVAGAVPLVIPRVHDCIALFLGDPAEYQREFRACPGTLYLTPGWCDKEAHPDQHRVDAARHPWSAALHPNYAAWAERYGEGNARMIVEFFQTWRRNYQRVAFINNGLGEIESYRAQAREVAETVGWRYEELPGSLTFIEDLVAGRWDEERFLVAAPGDRIVGTQDARLVAAVPAGTHPDAQPSAGAQRFVIADRKSVPGGPANGLGLGVDAGGTFTDAVLIDLDTGDVIAKAKAPTTHHDLTGAIADAVGRLDRRRFAEVRLVAISTTLATNAIVEGRGAKVGLLLMPWCAKSLEQITARPARIVPGRLNIDGEEVDPVDPAVVRQTVRELMDEGVEAFAISGYAGTHNPIHELQVQAAAREVTDLPVVCGHELSGRLDFIRRAHTAVLNARLLPTIGALLDAVDATLASYGVRAPVFVVRGDGSLIEMAAARERPIETLLSGPAASAGGARFLTGSDDLLAVDIGGTTTDIAIVSDGRVEVAPDGPTVGAWRTSVAAVDVLTAGLGGDSHVRVLEGGLKLDIGPARCIPLCNLAQRYPSIADELQAVRRRAENDPISPLEVECFELVGVRERLRLSDRELALVDLLARGPASRRTLAAGLGAVSLATLPTQRLEELGVIRRAAVTPTDALHVLGRFTAFDVAAAEHALAALGSITRQEPVPFAERIAEAFVRKLAYLMLRRELSLTLGDPDADDSRLLHRMIEAMLGPGDSGGAYALTFTERRTVVGIGAPAGEFLPAAGALLGAQVVVPEHAEVANAIGAVTGKVVVRARVSIRPHPDGGFLLYSALGRDAFGDLGLAQEAACEMLVKHLRERAGAYGTDEQDVTIDVLDRCGRLDDGSDLFLERVVEGVLEGPPRL